MSAPPPKHTEDIAEDEISLLPSSETNPTSTPTHMMGFDDTPPKPEARARDVPARRLALVAASTVVVVTWAMVFLNSPGQIGWFAFHPPLQTLAILAFTFGIITLQPTNQPKTKVAGLLRHQIAILSIGLPSILFGTFAVSYNKWLRNADHFTTWHGTVGIICVAWLIFQIILGAGSVWFGGSLFGGGLKAKNLWKYHRVSGYILFPSLLFSIHLGGEWSNWSAKYSIGIVRFFAFTIAPIAVVAGVYMRVRISKMPIFK